MRIYVTGHTQGDILWHWKKPELNLLVASICPIVEIVYKQWSGLAFVVASNPLQRSDQLCLNPYYLGMSEARHALLCCRQDSCNLCLVCSTSSPQWNLDCHQSLNIGREEWTKHCKNYNQCPSVCWIFLLWVPWFNGLCNSSIVKALG